MSENKSEKSISKESVTFFKTQDDFREWLEINHEKVMELIVGFYKAKSGKPSMNWSQSVDQALCFGWIDGIRKSMDEESYSIRFTPRKKTSIWSEININKVEELTKAGLMKPAGIKAFSFRKESKSGIYSYENKAENVDYQIENLFGENEKAREFFMKQTPSYRKGVLRWINSAVQEKTRQSRLEKTIKQCEQQKRIT